MRHQASTELHMRRRFQIAPAFHKIAVDYCVDGNGIRLAASLCIPDDGHENAVTDRSHETKDLGQSAQGRCQVPISRETIWSAVQCVEQPVHSQGSPSSKTRQQNCPCAYKSYLSNLAAWINTPPIRPTFRSTTDDECDHKAENLKASYAEPEVQRMLALMERALLDPSMVAHHN